MSKKQIVACLTLLTCVVVSVSSNSYEEDVSLTAKEKKALDKFKSLVIPKIPKSSYLQNYVKDDLYFIHWLRAKHIDVPATEQMFLSHLKWREQEKIDNIDNDGFDWSELIRDYPVYFRDAVDKEGKPIGEIWFGDWNIRQGAIAGLSKQLVHRIMARFFEVLTRRIYKARAEGRRVSKATLLIDLEGFNILQHTCPICLPVPVGIATLSENHYPFLFGSIYFVNLRPTFEILMRVLRPILRESTRNAIQSYTDKSKWLPALKERIDKSQRSVRFGGTIVRNRE